MCGAAFPRPTLPLAVLLAVALLHGASLAGAETLVLVDPDGNQVTVETDGPIVVLSDSAQPLTVDAEARSHLGSLTIQAGVAPPAFSPGLPFMRMDTLLYRAELTGLSGQALVFSAVGAPLDCMSASGVPVFVSAGVDANVDGDATALTFLDLQAVARIQPVPSGGSETRLSSIFGDVDCGDEFTDLIFLDSLEASP